MAQKIKAIAGEKFDLQIKTKRKSIQKGGGRDCMVYSWTLSIASVHYLLQSIPSIIAELFLDDAQLIL